MALIIEVLRGRSDEVRQRLRLEDGALTIGRGLANALVLDDPYVDATHARIVRAEDGSLVLEDLGSLNQIDTASSGRSTRVPVTAGTEVTLGRTRLRFRDEHAPVVAALPLPRGASMPLPDARIPWHDRTGGRLAIVATMLAVIGVSSWLDSVKHGAGTEALSAMIGAAIAGAVWAGIWGVAARAVIGQFRFLAHFTVLAVAVIVITLASGANAWAQFLFPDNKVAEVLGAVGFLGGLTAFVAAHLAHASHLSTLRRWRAGVVVSGLVLALGGVYALLDQEEFTAVATFSGVIKPVAAGAIPTESVEEFGAAAAKLRADVDSLLAKKKD